MTGCVNLFDDYRVILLYRNMSTWDAFVARLDFDILRKGTDNDVLSTLGPQILLPLSSRDEIIISGTLFFDLMAPFSKQRERKVHNFERCWKFKLSPQRMKWQPGRVIGLDHANSCIARNADASGQGLDSWNYCNRRSGYDQTDSPDLAYLAGPTYSLIALLINAVLPSHLGMRTCGTFK